MNEGRKERADGRKGRYGDTVLDIVLPSKKDDIMEGLYERRTEG